MAKCEICNKTAIHGNKLSINGFLGKSNINKKKEQEGIELTINERFVYRDFEEYSISIKNNTDKTILATVLKYNVLYYHKENLKKEENKKKHINIVENMYEYRRCIQAVEII